MHGSFCDRTMQNIKEWGLHALVQTFAARSQFRGHVLHECAKACELLRSFKSGPRPWIYIKTPRTTGPADFKLKGTPLEPYLLMGIWRSWEPGPLFSSERFSISFKSGRNQKNRQPAIVEDNNKPDFDKFLVLKGASF